MATSRQEQIYNEIVQYYDFADRLISTIEDNEDDLDREQMEVVEDVVENLEKYTDQLTTQFIEFAKDGNSREVMDEIRGSINGIISKIEECRNKIHKLYQL